MPGSKSDYNETRILNQELNGGGAVLPTTLHVALFSTAPGEAGGGVEITSLGRVAVARNITTWPTTTTNSISNGVVIDFGTAPADAADAMAFAVFDAATAGNPLRYGTLNAAQPIRAGNRISFPVGSLTFTED